ncbi:hypothetical protein [Acinetobacter haemolyticus]|uniref:OmpH family outer membrane protein n=1 Tax=Acinetobacter haemolyticus TaxID=29430 RepID=A0AAW4J7P4_ACIHA|nr:hypothetical protein [Acinetobacter haemolyticus]MBO3659105.1 hypothetical protein [Acinetobacter haemolyticus]
MSLNPNSKVIIPLGLIISFVIGLIYFLFDFTKLSPQQQPSNTSVNSPITSNINPAIQNIQNNNFKELADLNRDNRASQIEAENRDLKIVNSSLLKYKNDLEAKVTSLEAGEQQAKNENAYLKQQVTKLDNFIRSCETAQKEIQVLQKTNDKYFAEIQKVGGYMTYAPNAEQKNDFRIAIANNLKLIEGYQSQCKIN